MGVKPRLGMPPPQWVTSWPDWHGIHENVTVVPLDDYLQLKQDFEDFRRDQVAKDEDAFNCQMEGKPCDRWCGGNPCLPPESPAKEQPGEQNAAPHPNGSAKPSEPNRAEVIAAAAPDVAKLIRNLICADTATVVFAAREAAAFIEKLGQGWIPVSEAPLAIWGLVWAPIWRRPFPGMRNGDNGSVWIDTCETDAKGRQDYATHWQPLPPPPERP